MLSSAITITCKTPLQNAAHSRGTFMNSKSVHDLISYIYWRQNDTVYSVHSVLPPTKPPLFFCRCPSPPVSVLHTGGEISGVGPSGQSTTSINHWWAGYLRELKLTFFFPMFLPQFRWYLWPCDQSKVIFRNLWRQTFCWDKWNNNAQKSQRLNKTDELSVRCKQDHVRMNVALDQTIIFCL